MRAASALLAFVSTAAAPAETPASPTPTVSPTLPPGPCPCPAHSDGAHVYLNGITHPPADPLHQASDPNTGIVHGAPWNWITQDGVQLQPFPTEQRTLRCGNYYGWECRRTESGTVFKIDCKTATCDVYVFLYHEPPRSSNTNGRLPQTLPPDWEAGSCAPTFCVTPPARQAPGSRNAKPLQILPTASPTASPSGTQCCRMTAFRRQVDGPNSINFTIDEISGTMDAYYLLIAVAPGERCSSNGRSGGQAACEAEPRCGNALCRWEVSTPAPNPALQKQEQHPLVRAAKGLQILPTANPTASPVSGRCVPNWCPPGRPGQQPPTCDAPLTEPQCSAPCPWSSRQAQRQCTNPTQLAGDIEDNPVFGGSGFFGTLTLEECKAACADPSNVDGHGRRCVAIEWSDGGFTLPADAQRNCALAWGCSGDDIFGGGSIYRLTC